MLQAHADDDTGPAEFGELRSLTALRRMIGALAGPGRPVLLVLDDCQWSDTLTVRLLNETFGGTCSTLARHGRGVPIRRGARRDTRCDVSRAPRACASDRCPPRR